MSAHNAVPAHPLEIALPVTSPSIPRIRGWRRRFHSSHSPESVAAREAQLDDVLVHVAAGRYSEVLAHLDEGVLPDLARRLDPAQCLGLSWAAFHLARYDLGARLLQQTGAQAEAEAESRTEMLLLEALCLDRLGEISAARQRLERVLEDCDPSASEEKSEERLSPQASRASLALIWMDLRLGAIPEASERLRQLRRVVAPDDQQELEQIRKLLTSLQTLNHRDAEAIPSLEDLSRRFGVAIAIDNAILSRCGKLLELDGWLVDPRHQIEHAYLIREQRVWPLGLSEISTFERPDLEEVFKRCGGHQGYRAGFRLNIISQPEECLPLQSSEHATVVLFLKEGKQVLVRQKIKPTNLNGKQIRSLVNVAIDHQFMIASPELLRRTRMLWAQELDKQLDMDVDHHRFGALPPEPDLSVIVPLYGRIDFLEYQLNWFGVWQRKRKGASPIVQLIYVLDDPSLTEDCLTLAKRCHGLYGMPFELVINRENLGYAGANNRGAQHAKAPFLLLMNSDVLPEKNESLEIMWHALQQQRGRIGALGALLHFDNGAIQHQGMEFIVNDGLEGVLSQVWLNEHPCKGIHATVGSGEAMQLQEVEAASAACLMLPTRLFEAVGAFSLDYIVGDFEDSDLCLKIRRFGLPIAVDLHATFYHLERQSLGFHTKSSEKKMKLVAANAWLHHQRWCSSIERLKHSEMEA